MICFLAGESWISVGVVGVEAVEAVVSLRVKAGYHHHHHLHSSSFTLGENRLGSQFINYHPCNQGSAERIAGVGTMLILVHAYRHSVVSGMAACGLDNPNQMLGCETKRKQKNMKPFCFVDSKP